MIVGMTYDLRDDYLAEGYTLEETAEFDKRDTIDAIDEVLRSLGFETDLIGHARNLTARLVKGDRWDMVFNIAEGLRGFGREALIPSLLDAYDIPYTFSDPMVLTLTLHKGMCKRVVRDLGIPTPAFAVIESERDASRLNLPFPLFAKPVAEGTGKGITGSSRIRNREELLDTCRLLLERFHQPVLIETFLPGREFTVGVIGTGKDARSVGVLEILFKENKENTEGEVYSFFNKEHYTQVVEYRLVDDTAAKQATQMSLAAWRGLGCRDAGRIDLRADAQGHPHFLEINPLAGLHPVHSDLPILCRMAGIQYHDLIARIMESALKRQQPPPSLTEERISHSAAPLM